MIDPVPSLGRSSAETHGGGDAQDAASNHALSFWIRHGRAMTDTVAAVVAFGSVYYVVPRIGCLGPTLNCCGGGERLVAGVWRVAGGALMPGPGGAVT